MTAEKFSPPTTEDRGKIIARLKADISTLKIVELIKQKKLDRFEVDGWFDGDTALLDFFTNPEDQNWEAADVSRIEEIAADMRDYMDNYSEQLKPIQEIISKPAIQQILQGIMADWPQMDPDRFSNYTWQHCPHLSSHGNDLRRGSTESLLSALDYSALNGVLKELKELSKQFPPAVVTQLNEEFLIWKKKHSQKQQRESKETTMRTVVETFFRKRRLFSAIALRLTITTPTGMERSDQKKFENQLRNIPISDLERVLAYYQAVVKKTKELGGDTAQEEDLLLGLEESA